MMAGAARTRPCIVITYPFALGAASGGARMTREIARHLGKLGADVIVLPVSTTSHCRGPRPRLDDKALGLAYDEELRSNSVEVVRVPPHPVHGWLDCFHVRKEVRRVIERRRVDAVLGYYSEAALLPPLLRARHVRFGYIATWQSYRMALYAGRSLGRLRRAVKRGVDWRLVINPYRQSEVVFATSAFTRHELIDVLAVDGRRISVCHLGIDPPFAEVPRRPRGDVSRFVFFGRLVPEKGILDAVEALGRLAAKGLRDWTFRVMGSGGHDEVREAARQLGIGDQVEVMGPREDEALRAELEHADLAIMPSYAESFGLAFAEAQAAGLPVVAYHAGSVPEVIEDGVSGWLAPLRDVDRLAACIEAAVRDPRGTYLAGLAGRERVVRLFTWQKTAETILHGLSLPPPGAN